MLFTLRLRLLPFLLLLGSSLDAQVTNTATLDTAGGEHLGNLAIGAYLDLYYGYNLNENGSTLPYLVSSHHHNQLNINLAFVDLRYQSPKMRARLVPGFGTYMNANYVSEPGTLRNLVEANAGFKLSETKNIWLDAGVLGSPYTNESAISKDHLMYTRSLAPEYVPYYLCGIKLSSSLSKKINFTLYVLNGWQQINDQNNGKSIGTQFEFRPNAANLINWNTYVGDERSPAQPFNRIRYFSDIYWLRDAGKKWAFSSCIYAGRQDQKSNQNLQSAFYWWQANFIASYRFTDKLSLSARGEYFSDTDKQMIAAIGTTGFEGGSAGLCFNYKATEKSLIRIEARQFFSMSDQFINSNLTSTNQMTWLISSATVWF